MARMPRLTGRACARVLAGLYAALAAANFAAGAKRHRAGEWATKPLLMPVLAGFVLAATGDRQEGVRLPAAGMALSGLGDTALLGPESWFVPGMGAFAAAHACYITALARDGAARGVRPRVAAGYAALWAVLIAVLWRNLGALRVPVAAYSLLLVSMAVLASGRNRAAAAGGALFVVSDALIACGLAGINAVPRQEAVVMPTYVAAQFLLAAGFLRPPDASRLSVFLAGAGLRQWADGRQRGPARGTGLAGCARQRPCGADARPAAGRLADAAARRGPVAGSPGHAGGRDAPLAAGPVRPARGR